MKKLLILLAIPFSLHAQSDSLKVTFSEEKVEKFEKTTLIDEYEKAFGGNRVVKSGLRGRLSDPGMLNFQHFGLQFEQKISKSFSVIATVGNVFQFAGPSIFESDVEARWYFNMRKKVALGKQKPNITGNYIGLKVQYYHNPLNRDYINRRYYSNRSHLFSGFPNQTFLEDGYASVNLGRQFGNALNINLMLGLKRGIAINNYSFSENLNSNKIKHQIFLTSQNQIGLGIFLPRKKKINTNYCEFFKCNTNINNLWKLNLNNAFYLTKSVQNLKLDLAYERKIGKSPFSLNSEIVLALKNMNVPILESYKDTTVFGQNGEIYPFKIAVYSKNETHQPTFSVGIKEQLRYYIGMKDRINKGIQGNNFNGIYSGLEYLLNFSKVSYQTNLIGTMPTSVNLRALSVISGYQTQTNKNAYLDINFAFGVEIAQRTYTNVDYPKDWEGQPHLELSIKLGLAK